MFRHSAVSGKRVAARPLTRLYPRPSNMRMSAPQYSVTKDDGLRGYVPLADSWFITGEYHYGFYNLPTEAQGNFGDPIMELDRTYAYGYNDGNGHFYAVNAESLGYYTAYSCDELDPDTYEIIARDTFFGDEFAGYDCAVDPTTGTVYASMIDENNRNWWSIINLAEGIREDIAQPSVTLTAIACSPEGQFYGLGANGNLYSVDKATGKIKLVGPTGYVPEFRGGGVWNAKDNTMIVAFNTSSSAGMIEIDPATGTATLVTTFGGGEQATMLHFVKPTAQKAPAAPEISATCPTGNLTAHIELTLPTTFYDGSTCTDTELSYTVTYEGETRLSGTGAPGETVSGDIDTERQGLVSFKATVSNSAGTSPVVKTTCRTGKSTPLSPGFASLRWADGTATLHWEAVEEGVDNAYFDPEAVVYSVFDLNDNVLAEDLKTTTWTQQVAEPKDGIITLGYKVVAIYAARESEPTESNLVTIGAFSTPMAMDLTDYDNFTKHTVCDANEDGSSWEYHPDFNCAFSRDNTFNDSDDWLFSPDLRLEADKPYLFRAKVGNFATFYTPRLEIWAGQGADVDQMSVTIVSATDITADGIEMKGTLIVGETGRYNIGFHAISPNWRGDRVKLYDYSLSGALEAGAPDEVTDFEIVPEEYGSYNVSLNFRMPTESVTATALTDNVTVKVLRDGEQIASVTGQPGETGSVSDVVPEARKYTYRLVSYGADGSEGNYAELKQFVGPYAPDILRNIVMVESAPGELTVSWDPITMDEMWNEIPASNVTYEVYSIEVGEDGLYLDKLLTPRDFHGTTFTTTFDEPDNQEFHYLGIIPYNRDVMGMPMAANCIVGKAYEMPVSWSKEKDAYTHFLATGGEGDVYIGEFNEISAQDGDGEFFGIRGQDTGCTYIQLGKVKLSDNNPVMVLYIHTLANQDEPDVNYTEVEVTCEGKIEIADVIENRELAPDHWNKYTVNLAAYKGKEVQITLKAYFENFRWSYYDNITIKENPVNDLSASIEAPKDAVAFQEFDISVTAANEGVKDAAGYTVELLRDGKCVETRDISESLAPGEKAVTVFKQAVTLNDEGVEYQAKVILKGDEDPTNDLSAPATVTRTKSSLPVPEGLTGENEGSDNSLSWNAVDMNERHPSPVTEDFERYESFVNTIDDWTFIDVDQKPTGAIDEGEIPGLSEGDLSSYIVFDTTYDFFYDFIEFSAKSGSKYLASVHNADWEANDDWAISPLLTGEEQEIMFSARCCSLENYDSFELWISDKDSTDPADFTFLGNVGPIEEWADFWATMPEGTKRFAFRNVSVDGYMLMIDDVRFRAMMIVDAQLLGYNIYCDGVKINDNPLTAPEFVHAADGKTHVYNVTAVYDKGESEYSAPVTIESSSLDTVSNEGVSVVAVYNLQGIRLYGKPTKGQIVIEKLSDGTSRKVRR